MSLPGLALAFLRERLLASLLQVLLLAVGLAAIVFLLLAGSQLAERVSRDTRGIDLVVGAKGSPLQLVLSAVFHVDTPTGNIPLDDALALRRNPLVRSAIPLALGDTYAGYRIVGTEPALIEHYGARLAAGAAWSGPMEVVVGATVARERGLRVGDTVVGSHGLGEGGEAHDEHPYRVTGVLAPTGGVVDRLLLTSLESVWAVHAPPGEPVASGSAAPADGKPARAHAHDHAHDRTSGVGAAGPRTAAAGPAAPPATAAPPREVTALLIRYASPIAAAQLPRQVNARSAMQAASPAVESARLVRLLGVGMDALRVFAWVLIGTAGVALFISLFVAISERRRDLALLRSLGLSRPRLFALVLLEGLMLCAAGGALGLAAGHLTAELVGRHVRAAADWALTGAVWAPGEGLLLLAALAIGLVAALLPAVLAYRMDVARELARG